MKKNVIITPTGRNSLYKDWIGENKDNNFDIIFLCYEDNDFYKELISDGHTAYKCSGEKWTIIKNFLKEHSEVIKNYDFFWFPDDDLFIKNFDINLLFDINKKWDLLLSQPSASGFTSHIVTNKKEGSTLRFTNFVEIMCPLMSRECLLQLMDSFDYSKSGWGLDVLWPKILNYPKDKIAIIDSVSVIHTRPVGENYNGRFEIDPYTEMLSIIDNYNLHFNIVEYDYIK
jgi:hypothetical protein